MNGFIGGGAHWRVLRFAATGRRSGVVYYMWAIHRRHWDRWERVGGPYYTLNEAMTEAHRLARLNRA